MGAFQRSYRGTTSRRTWTACSSCSRAWPSAGHQKAGHALGGEQQMCAIGRALMAKPDPADARRALDGPRADLRRADLRDDRRSEQAGGVRSCSSSRTHLMALEMANRGYVLETRHGRARRRGEGAPETRSPQDLPRRDLASADPHREVRRREQEADRARPPGPPARHLKGRPDAVHGHETQLPDGGGSPVPATITAPSRPSAGWHAFQSRNGSSGCTVRLERYNRSRVLSATLAPRPRAGGIAPARVAWKNARYGCCVG